MKVSTTQMAKVIGVSRQTIVTWRNRGLLSTDAQLIGGRWVIDWHDFLFDGSPAAHWLNPEYAKVQPKRSGRPKGSKDFAPRVRIVKKKYKRAEKRRLECREKLGSIVRKIKAAHFRLCYSRKMFVVAYPCETQEMVLDAHNRAFIFFGGIPVTDDLRQSKNNC